MLFSPPGRETACGPVQPHRRDRFTRHCNAVHRGHRGLLREPVRVSPSRNRRDDARPGLRITHYKKGAVIAFDVNAEQVFIIGLFYGGQDYETILPDNFDMRPFKWTSGKHLNMYMICLAGLPII